VFLNFLLFLLILWLTYWPIHDNIVIIRLHSFIHESRKLHYQRFFKYFAQYDMIILRGIQIFGCLRAFIWTMARMTHITAIRAKEGDWIEKIKSQYHTTSVMRWKMTFWRRLQWPINALHDHTEAIQTASVVLWGQDLGLLKT